MSVVFWDFDGTLVHSDDHWSRCAAQALCETAPGCTVDPAAFGKQLRSDTPGICIPWRSYDEDHTRHTGAAFWEHLKNWYAVCYMRLGVHEDTARAAAERIPGLIARAENYTLFPDTAAALERVKKLGHKNVLISNNYPGLGAVMDELGILGYFEGLVVSGEAGCDKPRREIFDMAKRMYPAHRYYMVGDNPNADVTGAQRAGITAIHVHSGSAPHADHEFESLIQVAELLENE